MDKAKILRLCNEIEMIMCEVYNTGHTMQDCDYEAIDKRLKAVVAEITAPPETNGDRIRQMTDEELAALIANENDFCSLCAYKSDPLCFKQPAACTHGFYEWLKQEVSEDD